MAGSFKGKGIAKELLEYAINDSKEKGMSGICTLTSKKKKPFIGEKKFFEHYGFKVVDEIGDYQLLALQYVVTSMKYRFYGMDCIISRKQSE